MTEGQKPDEPRAKPSASDVERGDIAYWKERAQSLFGVSEHLIAGALHGDRRKTFTQEQVDEALKNFTDPKKTPGS